MLTTVPSAHVKYTSAIPDFHNIFVTYASPWIGLTLKGSISFVNEQVDKFNWFLSIEHSILTYIILFQVNK